MGGGGRGQKREEEEAREEWGGVRWRRGYMGKETSETGTIKVACNKET